MSEFKNRQLTPIPLSWVWTSVGEITDVIRGASPRPKGDPKYFGGSIPWIMIADVTRQKGKYLLRTREGVTEAGASLSRRVQAGELILSNSATVCVPKILHVEGCIHDGFVTFPTLKKHTDLLFAYYWFEYVRPFIIQENRQGVTQVNLNTDIVREMHFPLPPLAEQRRIVGKVEELFSELDAGVANLKQARAQLAVYRQALLKHAFEGHLTADWRKQHASELESADQLLARIRAEREERYQRQLKEWEKAMEKWALKKVGTKPEAPSEPKPITPIAQLADLPKGWLQVCVGDILIGKPTNGRSVTDRAGGFKVLRLTSLKDGIIDLSANKEGDWDESEAHPYILKVGDFLISRGNGSLRLVGRGGVVKDSLSVAYPDTMVRLVVDPLAFDFRLFCLLWNSEVFRQQIESSARTTAGIYKINQAIISNFTFPLMPLAEQAVLLELLEAQLPHISRLEADIDLNLQKAEALRQSILKKAFAGELVPQDPADEPAAALLARIRAEREAAAAKPVKPKRSKS